MNTQTESGSKKKLWAVVLGCLLTAGGIIALINDSINLIDWVIKIFVRTKPEITTAVPDDAVGILTSVHVKGLFVRHDDDMASDPIGSIQPGEYYYYFRLTDNDMYEILYPTGVHGYVPRILDNGATVIVSGMDSDKVVLSRIVGNVTSKKGVKVYVYSNRDNQVRTTTDSEKYFQWLGEEVDGRYIILCPWGNADMENAVPCVSYINVHDCLNANKTVE
ncbi:hypothetical protein FACS1894184_17200 [Clostridia bacterium]|nr:hypothetical protein FACS1894184_17200 [Clostridia bacterium]